MSVTKEKLVAILSPKIPNDILINMLDEYQQIKQQFFLRKFQPSELNAARFGECVLRLLEYLDTGNYTPFGATLGSQQIIRRIENNATLQDTIRFFIPRLVRVVLDVRNKRDVAHVGGEVSPNYSDAIFVTHAADWLLTEIIRHFHNCSIVEAQAIVTNINEVRIPVVAEIDGFIRVQNTKLSAREKVLIILYYKKPDKVRDIDLLKWSRYANEPRFKSQILTQLDKEALIHYEGSNCTLLPKGIGYIEKNISLSLLV